MYLNLKVKSLRGKWNTFETWNANWVNPYWRSNNSPEEVKSSRNQRRNWNHLQDRITKISKNISKDIGISRKSSIQHRLPLSKNLAWELQKLWIVKVNVFSVIVGALEIVPRVWVRLNELGIWEEFILYTLWYRWGLKRYLKRSWWLEKICYYAVFKVNRHTAYVSMQVHE